MELQSLLGDLPKQQFVAQYFHRLPFSLPGTACSLCDRATWQVLGRILAAPEADTMVVRAGRQCTDAPPATVEAARKLVNGGHTILVRHAEKHDRHLHELAMQFERDFAAPVDIHIYVTPPGQHGFSWHYDAEDVFIVQTAGEKQYSLRKNTVHPWPLVETIPVHMNYRSELMPLMRVLLKPGDWLYIPCGYWHKAEAQPCGEPSISLALGVLSPAAVELLDHLRAHVVDSLLWRGRLPVNGTARSLSDEELLEHYRELGRLLSDDLRRTLLDEQFLRDFLRRQQDA